MVATLRSEYPLPVLLQVANLARSTFYYQLGQMQAQDRHVKLKQAIRKIFDKSHQRYGYRRVRLQLLRDGWCVSRKLVAKLMRQLGLRSKTRKRKCYNSYRGTTSRRADNHLDRRFATEKPNQQWVSDITQFQISGQKLYLSPVMDLCDHSILAHTLSVSPTTKVSALSLKRAFRVAGDPEGVLVHTDQGYHYQHQSWISQLVEHQCVQSMSRKGNCYDNSVMENFFSHLKEEMFNNDSFASISELRAAIDEYIQWYNTERMQERLGGMTPNEYRQHALSAIG